MDANDPRVKENIDELAAALARTDDGGFIADFLHCLLTPAEMADVAGRWALVKELKRKVPHRKIAKSLGVSLCKITRGSRVLKKPDSAFARIFSDGASAMALSAMAPSALAPSALAPAAAATAALAAGGEGPGQVQP